MWRLDVYKGSRRYIYNFEQRHRPTLDELLDKKANEQLSYTGLKFLLTHAVYENASRTVLATLAHIRSENEQYSQEKNGIGTEASGGND